VDTVRNVKGFGKEKENKKWRSHEGVKQKAHSPLAVSGRLLTAQGAETERLSISLDQVWLLTPF
ncbi:MAG: hypothetical protein ABI396_06295, partial [Ktedonobacteraceae bacterium]